MLFNQNKHESTIFSHEQIKCLIDIILQLSHSYSNALAISKSHLS